MTLDPTLIVACLLSVLLVFVVAMPFLLRNTNFSDQVYILLKSYRRMTAAGGHRPVMFIVQSLKPYMSKWALRKLERLLRLSGKSGRTAEELFLYYILVMFPTLFIASQLQHAKIQAMILAFGVPLLHIRRLYSAAIKRQLEAEEATRFLKRQLVLVLRQNVPVMDALDMMANGHPGEFGETFNRCLRKIHDGTSLRQGMKELREEYETRSLDDLCLAIELSDSKSPETLADNIYLQTMDENARVDEFIDKKKESSNKMMMVVIALGFIWTLAVFIYFAWYGFMDYFRGRGGFLNF
jgi:Flp pilus assembly protein TadB